MCLAVPMRIKKILPEGHAHAEIGGIVRSVNIKMLAQVKVGEYVLVHAGFAIGKVDQKEARETLRIIDEIR